jgi:hypothetical protein
MTGPETRRAPFLSLGRDAPPPSPRPSSPADRHRLWTIVRDAAVGDNLVESLLRWTYLDPELRVQIQPAVEQ